MARIIEQSSTLPTRNKNKRKLPGNTSLSVINKCNGDKWRSAHEIAKRCRVAVEDVPRLIHLVQSHKHRAKVETKKVGKEIHYRIFEKDKTVSVQELTTKLSPIIDGLIAEGKKNMATMVPATVAMLAAKLKRLLDEWAE
jgi:hypothetical protein